MRQQIVSGLKVGSRSCEFREVEEAWVGAVSTARE